MFPSRCNEERLDETTAPLCTFKKALNFYDILFYFGETKAKWRGNLKFVRKEPQNFFLSWITILVKTFLIFRNPTKIW